MANMTMAFMSEFTVPPTTKDKLFPESTGRKSWQDEKISDSRFQDILKDIHGVKESRKDPHPRNETIQDKIKVLEKKVETLSRSKPNEESEAVLEDIKSALDKIKSLLDQQNQGSIQADTSKGPLDLNSVLGQMLEQLNALLNGHMSQKDASQQVRQVLANLDKMQQKLVKSPNDVQVVQNKSVSLEVLEDIQKASGKEKVKVIDTRSSQDPSKLMATEGTDKKINHGIRQNLSPKEFDFKAQAAPILSKKSC